MAATDQFVVLGPHPNRGRRKDNKIHLIRADHRKAEPCQTFARGRYKGLRFPYCGCMPCLTKFLENQKELGKPVVWMPLGWSLNSPTTGSAKATEVAGV